MESKLMANVTPDLFALGHATAMEALNGMSPYFPLIPLFFFSPYISPPRYSYFREW
jgi:hypothetical protein